MAILGIDEVGRGPLAGPLVVGAVVLPKFVKGEEPEWFFELKDSKKLSARKREALSEIILAEAATGLGFVSAEELDKVGVSEALRLATRRAVKSVQGLHAAFSQIVIDGKVNFLAGTALGKYVTTVVKADDLIREVSAASIIAKVARDRYMVELDSKFPGYGFAKNVGYGTKVHMEAISKLGICPEHRKSYEPCKSLSGFSREKIVRKDTTSLGVRGEEATCQYLVGLGHEILERNFKTKLYEIDIVSVSEGKIYFTEVKYRKNRDFGGGLMAIDAKKRQKMRFAAESFLKYRKEFAQFDPLLAVASVAGENFEVEDWFTI
ncbi:MAG: ribonuclease HII [Candidatus Saccharibacteria bacterium]|nr:ribonuclease HII [Candidatus Saccharibacteria bacterium]